MKNVISCRQFVSVIIILAAGSVPAMVTDVPGLVNAVNNGSANDTIIVGPGTFELTGPLRPKDGMTIRGAGVGVTIIINHASWDPGTADLPEGGTNTSAINRNAYLFDLGDNTINITISDMTLKGPQLHGALYGNNCDGLEMYNLKLKDFLWSGIRTFRMDNGLIHDNVFENAGGEFGPSGGALFLTWVKYSEFWNNWIYKTGGENFYGFKGRKAKHCRFHHNTVEVGFSLEFPFENDEYNEIDHNAFWGPISIPKAGGGPVVENGYTWHIHHNWLQKSYSLEWARNSAIIEYNLFDFDTSDDKGNLISNFGAMASPGPTHFSNNLIMNPGRGIFWSKGVYNQFYFHNNHIKTHRTVTPRTDGLFGLPSETDFSTIEIKNNIIECYDIARPLMRNSASYAAIIENNTLTNVSDSGSYANPDTGQPRGPVTPLLFTCGKYDEFLVDGWNVGPAGGNFPPTAAPQAIPDTGYAPLTVGFFANADDPDNDPLTYKWDFDGDGTWDDFTENPSWEYTRLGNYSVALEVSDGTYTVSKTLPVAVLEETGTPTIPDMTGYWPLDGNAADALGAHHGTEHGSSGYAPGKVGQARILDGSTDYILVSEKGEWDPRNGQDDLTVSAWCWRGYAESGGRILFGQRDGSAWNDNGVTWILNAPHYQTGFKDYSDAANTGGIPQDQWHHLAGVYDASEQLGILYIDGEEAARDDTWASLGNDRTNPISIGGLSHGGQFHIGMADEMRIFARALTREEVIELMEYNGSAAFNFAPVITLVETLAVSTGQSFQLNPLVRDDNKPWLEAAAGGEPDNPTPVGLSYAWTVIDPDTGDGVNPADFVRFKEADSMNPEITVFEPGEYVLQLTAFDDQHQVSPQSADPNEAGKCKQARVRVTAAGDSLPGIREIAADPDGPLILSVSSAVSLDAALVNAGGATCLWEVLDPDPTFLNNILLLPGPTSPDVDVVLNRGQLGSLLNLPADEARQIPFRLTVTDTSGHTDRLTVYLQVRDPDCEIAAEEFVYPMDYNKDCRINIEDFAELAALWLMSATLDDLAEFSDDWLDCYDPLSTDPECVNPYAL